MNTKYSIKKVWYYLLCMIMTLQLIACTEETHRVIYCSTGGRRYLY